MTRWILAAALVLMPLAANAAVVPIHSLAGFGAGALDGGHPLTRTVTNCGQTGSGTLRSHIDYVIWLRGYEIAHGQEPRGVYIKFYPGLICDTTFTTPLPAIPNRVAITGAGSTLRGTFLNVENVDHVFIEDLRIYDTPANTDGVQIKGSQHVTIANVSVLRAGDGSIDVVDGSSDVTVMYSILSGTLTNKNMIVFDSTCAAETKRVSLIANLFVNSSARNPFIQRDNCGNVATDTTVDMRHNLVANWSSFPDPNVAGQGTVVIDGAKVNIEANYYTAPNVPPGNLQRQQNAIFVCHPDATTGCAGQDAVGNAYVPFGSNVVAQQPLWDFHDAEATTDVQFTLPAIQPAPLTSCEAAALVMQQAGAAHPGRDADEQAQLDSVVVVGC